jgi:hypothetical protein
VKAVPITEKLLLNAEGWQAMKPGRGLLKTDRVSEAKHEPPLLSGYVREGVKSNAPACRITIAFRRVCGANRPSKKLPSRRPPLLYVIHVYAPAVRNLQTPEEKRRNQQFMV